jgi:hypothetical protein
MESFYSIGGAASVRGRPRAAIRLSAVVYALFSLVISFILGSRIIPIAWDDLSYLEHFSGNFFVSDGALRIFEEPLWGWYTAGLGALAGQEFALRATIFFASIFFLWCAFRVNNKGGIFLILVFLFSSQLAVQLYFNQIRQGVALTIFLAGFCGGYRRGVFFAAVASLVHTSFLFIFLIMTIVYILRSTRIRTFYIITIFICLAPVFLLGDLFEFYSPLLGRRSESYGFGQALNLNFFLIWPPFFLISLLISRGFSKNLDGEFFWRFTFLFVCSVIGFTFIFEAAARLLYFAFIFIPLLIIQGFPSRRAVYLSFFWFFTIFSYNWYESFLKDLPFVETLFGRWGLILSSF